KAGRIELVAGGTIGSMVTGANPDFIEVDESVSVTAVAANNIWIENTANSLNVRDVVSRTGDVFLKAQLSILDAVDVLDPTAPTFYNPLATSTDVTSGTRGKANVLGNNITLVATLGTIGELGNDLEIDSDYSNTAVVGTLTSSSSDNTFLTESTGALWLKTVTAGSGATAFVTNPVGSIFNGNLGGDNAVSGKLWLFASANIGTALNPLATRTGNIKGKATTGDVFIDNAGAVAIGGVSGGAAGDSPAGIEAGGFVLFGAHSPVTYSQESLVKEPIVGIWRDSADNTADFVTINEGIQLVTSAAAGIPLSGLEAGQSYYVHFVGANQIQLIDAPGGSVVAVGTPAD